MGKITDIEELIANAKAEEEVNKTAQDDLTEAFMRKFVADLNKGAEEKTKGGAVSVPLSEYVNLKQIERDFALLIHAITSTFELGWRHESVRIGDGDFILQTIKVLWPEIVAEIEENLIREWNEANPNGEEEDE